MPVMRLNEVDPRQQLQQRGADRAADGIPHEKPQAETPSAPALRGVASRSPLGRLPKSLREEPGLLVCALYVAGLLAVAVFMQVLAASIH